MQGVVLGGGHAGGGKRIFSPFKILTAGGASWRGRINPGQAFMRVVFASAALATLAAAYALVRTASERWAALSRTVMLLSEQCRKQQLAIARLEQKQQSISEAAQSSSAPPPAEPEVGPSDEVIAAARAARADAESLMAAARAWCPPPAPVVC